MIRALLLVLCTLCLSVPLQALDMDTEQGNERLNQLQARRERAADFRLRHSVFQAPAGFVADAASTLERAEAHWQAGEVKKTYKLSWKAYNDYRHAPSAPRLLHLFILAAIKRHKISYATRGLIDLWYRYPDYARIDELMLTVLDEAERLQNSSSIINLDASQPDAVINTDVEYDLYAADLLFYFLAEHGDLHQIAPRASIGLARSLLISGDGGKLRTLEARLAYQEFLFRYPDSNLVFRALSEMALTHLLLFRGERFDGGALAQAELIINQAELYIEGRPTRQALVRQYRELISRWRQRKDFSVAQWYQAKDHPEAALYYYRESLRYDPDSTLAQEARRAIAALEPALDEP